jgi:hypothetical protein
VVDIAAGKVAVIGNVVRRPNDTDSIWIKAPQFTAVGNLVYGHIRVNTGSGFGALPPPWNDLNVLAF